MSSPSVWKHIRQTLGRAFRETGQALDRVALTLSGITHAASSSLTKEYRFYGGNDPTNISQDFLSRHRKQFPLLHAGRPVVHPEAALVTPCATLIGSVRIDAGASVWYGAVLRADGVENAESWDKTDEELLNGQEKEYKMLQEQQQQQQQQAAASKNNNTTSRGGGVGVGVGVGGGGGGAIYVGVDSNLQDGVVVTARRGSTRIGRGVTVGHLAQIHSATVDDYSLIGMGSIVQEGARVESEAFVAAGAVVGRDTVVRSGELWVGSPARKLRDLSPAERQKLHFQSSEYVKVARGQQNVMQLGGNLTESMLLPVEEVTKLLEGKEDSIEAEESQTIMGTAQVEAASVNR